MSDDRLGLQVTHRRYVSYADAHYAGDLVAGAFLMGLFGDVATEVCIRTDGDEGLLASYADVQFRAPVRAGDVVEVTATVTRVGNRSRDLDLEARVVCRSAAAVAGSDTAAGAGATDETPVAPSSAVVLEEPFVAATARATVVVPVPRA